MRRFISWLRYQDDHMTFNKLVGLFSVFVVALIILHFTMLLAAGQEITRASSAPIEIGRIEFFDVEGISIDQFDKAEVRVYPTGFDVELRTMYDRGPDGFKPVLLFRANEANANGRYDLIVAYPDGKEVGLIEYEILTAPKPVPPDDPQPSTVSQVTYIYEKDETAPPPEVSGELLRLNQETEIAASEIDDDVVDGSGEVPDQYKKSIQAAREHGLPCLVIQDDQGNVLAVVASPTTAEDIRKAVSLDFQDHMWIEPREWKQWAEWNDEFGLWPEDIRNRLTNQDPTHECTCHCLVQNVEMAYNAAQGGKVYPVYLSPLSVYSEANPRRRGGAGMWQTLKIAMERGILPDKVQPSEYGFEHTLHGTEGRGNEHQSTGPWVALRDFPDGWQGTARHFKPLEIISPESWEELVCLILRRRAIGYGRSGHAVPPNKVVWDERGSMYFQYPDSYDVIRYDSMRSIRAGVRSSYCIWSTTVPDDWSKPAS